MFVYFDSDGKDVQTRSGSAVDTIKGGPKTMSEDAVNRASMYVQAALSIVFYVTAYSGREMLETEGLHLTNHIS